MTKKRSMKIINRTIFIILLCLSIVFLAPILIVFINSFKGKFFISEAPFQFITEKTFVGLNNYTSGIEKIGFVNATGWSLFITIGSVAAIIFFTSMTAWYITRVKNKFNGVLYYVFVFSMVVPFQMVMFTMTKVANVLHLDNPMGIIIVYLGFGTGLSIFMFCGFIKSVPIELEEAAMIDGCNSLQTFFRVVMPVLKPIAVTVGILNTMWVWNDYLLPLLLIGTEYRTIPVAIQYLKGGYGSVDMGAMMAMLILAVIPIIIFYMFCQKHIIEGVVTGAVKG